MAGLTLQEEGHRAFPGRQMNEVIFYRPALWVRQAGFLILRQAFQSNIECGPAGLDTGQQFSFCIYG